MSSGAQGRERDGTLASAGQDDVLARPKGRHALRGVAEHELGRNAYVRFRGEASALPRWIFPTVLVVFSLVRILSIAVVGAAWAGWFLEPATWSTGAPATAAHHTPFHHHPNLYGWRWGFQGLVHMHLYTGIGLLLVCLVPLFAEKGGRVHRLFGRAFAGLWVVHLLNGLTNSAQILLTRGFEPARYLSETKQGFSLYLYVQFAFISALVVDFLAHGLAALHHKNRRPTAWVRAAMLGLPLTSTLMGATMAAWAAAYLVGISGERSPVATEFAIVFLVQVPAYVFLAAKNMAYWARPTPRVWLQGWVTEHQRNMMFCVGVTLYTAAANVTMRFAPWLTAPLFASIDVAFLVWLLTRERTLRREVVAGRLGIAMVSHLARLPRAAPEAPMGEREAAWILRMFDRSGNGTLEFDEVRGLLLAQGIAAQDPEVEQLFREVDADGDGHVDREELARFLARGFAGDVERREELAYCFRRLDTDGDGRLTREELEAAAGGAPASRAAHFASLARGVERRRGAAVGLASFSSAVDSERPPPEVSVESRPKR